MNKLLANHYYRPDSVAEVVKTLSQLESVKILAGGTDLIIELRERKTEPDAIVDISDIKELKQISTDGKTLHIGSAASFCSILSNEKILQYCPPLADAASQLGAPTVLSRATIGGNVANAAAAGDSIPVLLALDAEVKIVSTRGEKTVPVRDIVTGINKNNLEPDELITEFIIPIRQDAFMAFEKLGRRKTLAISRINLAVVLEFAKDGAVSYAAVAVGAVGETAYRVQEVEKFLLGKKLNETVKEETAELMDNTVAYNLAGRKTTPYKRKIAAAVMRQALEKAMKAPK